MNDLMTWVVTQMMLMSSKITRHFTTLKSASSQHFTIPTITLTGNFDIQFEVTGVDTSVAVRPLGTAANTDEIQIDYPSNDVSFTANSNTITFTNALTGIDDVKLNVYKFVRTGTSVELFINGVSKGTQSNSDSVSFDLIGKHGVNLFDGIISSVKITDAGTLTRDYKINENWSSTTLLDSSGNNQHGTAVNINSVDAELFTEIPEGWIGVELWTFPIYTYTGSELDNDIIQSENTLVSGYRYRTAITVAGSNTGSMTRALTGNQTILSSSNSTVVDDVTATSPTNRWQARGTPPFSGTVVLSTMRLLEVA